MPADVFRVQYLPAQTQNLDSERGKMLGHSHADQTSRAGDYCFLHEKIIL
jgi:hypothetical protein